MNNLSPVHLWVPVEADNNFRLAENTIHWLQVSDNELVAVPILRTALDANATQHVMELACDGKRIAEFIFLLQKDSTTKNRANHLRMKIMMERKAHNGELE